VGGGGNKKKLKNQLSLAMNPFAKGVQTTARELVMSSYEIQSGIAV
jgi:hypothetical protein